MNQIIDQDSGLVLVNYKEPLKKVVKGFGYEGALLSTPDGEKIQCHICGNLYGELFKHFNQAHGLNKDQYTERFDLARDTALISEKVRIERQQRQIKYLASLTFVERMERRKRAIAAIKKFHREHPNHNKPFKIRLETKNKRGTCPDQLIDKVKKVAEKIGHTPSKNEFIDECGSQRYIHLIYTTFGSYKKAVQLAGLPERMNKTTKDKIKPRHRDEELIEYLQLFYRENNRIPTETDCKRGMIPASTVYKRRWGSFPRAREIAGLPELIHRSKR